MIQLTKLNGAAIFVNPDLIRFIEKAPDTLLIFTDGKTLLARDTPEEICQRIIEYRKQCALKPS
jgi:flagellar protein FlbD